MGHYLLLSSNYNFISTHTHMNTENSLYLHCSWNTKQNNTTVQGYDDVSGFVLVFSSVLFFVENVIEFI